MQNNMSPSSSRPRPRRRNGQGQRSDADGWLTLGRGTQQEQEAAVLPTLSYSCPYCPKTFLSSQAFGRHTASHQRERDTETGSGGGYGAGRVINRINIDPVTSSPVVITMLPPGHGPSTDQPTWFGPGFSHGHPSWVDQPGAGAAGFNNNNIVPTPYYHPNYKEIMGQEIRKNTQNLVRGLINVDSTEGIRRTDDLAAGSTDQNVEMISGNADQESTSMETLDLTLRL